MNEYCISASTKTGQSRAFGARSLPASGMESPSSLSSFFPFFFSSESLFSWAPSWPTIPPQQERRLSCPFWHSCTLIQHGMDCSHPQNECFSVQILQVVCQIMPPIHGLKKAHNIQTFIFHPATFDKFERGRILNRACCSEFPYWSTAWEETPSWGSATPCYKAIQSMKVPCKPGKQRSNQEPSLHTCAQKRVRM